MVDSLVLQQEQEERKEMESAVNVLKRRLGSIKEKCASVDAEIEQYRSMVATLERGMPFPGGYCNTLAYTTARKGT